MLKNSCKFLIGAAFFALTGSGAQAATYTFDFTGPDFASPVSFVSTNSFNPGNQGYAGGPDQLWAYTSVSVIGGWPDFFPGGEQFAFEATNLTPSNLFLASSTPFFSLGFPAVCPVASPCLPFDLSFPGLTNNAGVETVSLTNNGCNAPGYGNLDTLTITAAPEPSTWVMMLLGFAGLGFAGYRKARKASVVSA